MGGVNPAPRRKQQVPRRPDDSSQRLLGMTIERPGDSSWCATVLCRANVEFDRQDRAACNMCHRCCRVSTRGAETAGEASRHAKSRLAKFQRAIAQRTKFEEPAEAGAGVQ